VVPLRPLALGEILDGAIKVVRQHPRPTLGLSAVIALVVTLLNIGTVLLLDSSLLRGGRGFGQPQPVLDSNELAAGVASGIAPQVLSFLAGLVLTGALITVVGRAVQGQAAPTGEVWAAVRPRLIALLGLALLTGLLVMAPTALAVAAAVGLFLAAGDSTLLLGIPLVIAGVAATLYLYGRLALGPGVLVLEKAGVTQSLRRSSALVRGSWWRVFGILLLTLVIAGMLAAVIGVPIVVVATVVVGGGGDPTLLLIAQQVAGGLAAVLVSPFSAGVRALLYVDQRMRREGLDVALRAAVESRPAG